MRNVNNNNDPSFPFKTKPFKSLQPSRACDLLTPSPFRSDHSRLHVLEFKVAQQSRKSTFSAKQSATKNE